MGFFSVWNKKQTGRIKKSKKKKGIFFYYHRASCYPLLSIGLQEGSGGESFSLDLDTVTIWSFFKDLGWFFQKRTLDFNWIF